MCSIVAVMPIHDIAFFAALFFLAGVGGAGLGISIIAVIFASALTAGFLFWGRRSVLSAFAVFMLVGYFYFHLFYAIGEDKIVFNERIDFRGLVIEEPERNLESQRLTLKLYEPYRGEVTIYAPSYPQFNYGDLLNVSGIINRSPSGKINTASFPEIFKLKSDNGSKIKSWLFALKGGFVKNLETALNPDEAALLSGLTVGERAGFSKQFREAMSKSGTTHIVALSGYNISIIAVAISIALGSFLSRAKAFYVSVVAIILFVVMAGAEASVVRAAIMGVVVLVAERTSRLYSFRNAITLAAFFMVLFNPKLPVFDAGFQLSFAALMGIVYLMPAIKKIFKISGEKGFLGWRENGLATVSAQLAVIPILLWNFGGFSLTSVVSNILILGIMPLVMLLGFVLGVAGFFSYHLSLFIGWFANLLLKYQIAVIDLFSRLFIGPQVNSFPFLWGAIYYVLLVGFVIYAGRYVEYRRQNF